MVFAAKPNCYFELEKMRPRRFCHFIANSLGIIKFFTWIALSTNANAVDMATIEQAWRNREEKTNSIVIKWSESRVNRLPGGRGELTKKEIPQQVPELAMYFSGGKVRYETALMNKEADDPLERDIGAFNGREARDLFFPPNYPSGMIYAEKRPHFASRLSAWPLLVLYRGCDGGLVDCSLSHFFVKDGPESGERDVNVMLESHLANDGVFAQAKWRLLLSPQFDYAPLELSAWVGTKRTVCITLALRRGEDQVVVPESWTLSAITPGGLLLQAIRARVSSVSVGQPIENRMFDLPFPEGTLYFDMRDPTKRREFLIVKGGDTREVLPEEWMRGASYQELLHSGSGEAALFTPRAERSSVFFWLNVAVIVLATTLLAWFRLSKRRV